jgi:hypothetical protein
LLLSNNRLDAGSEIVIAVEPYLQGYKTNVNALKINELEVGFLLHAS